MISYSPPPAVRIAMLLLFQQHLVWSAATSREGVPTIHNLHHSPESEIQYSGKHSCTVDELLPDYALEDDLSSNWDQDQLVSPPFNCTCSTLKASYVCPKLGNEGYPMWVPTTVSSGSCKPLPTSALEHEPFPPSFKVLFYGNSHLRQVVEGIVCAYSHTVKQRRLKLTKEETNVYDVLVSPEFQCRSCESRPDVMMDVLMECGCLKTPVAQACRCDDDNALFEFENGAVVQYHFAHREEGKRIEDALRVYGTKFSDYDAIFANPGNRPRLETSEVLRTTTCVKGEGVPLFWLSTYDGFGDIRDWTHKERRKFKHSGARFVPIHDMVESMSYLTKGVVEGERNSHFCMPGPPNEIGILLLKVAWALRANEDRDN